jgi:hypothetical protein
MLVNILKNINNFFVNFFEFLHFRKKPLLNNDIESCCVLLDDTEGCDVLKDSTTTFSE